MKIFKGLLIIALALAIFTSSSFANITDIADKTIDVALNVYSKAEDYILERSQVTEVQYEEYYLVEPQFDSACNSLNYNQKEIYKILYAISQEMPKGYVKLYKQYDSISRDIAVAYNALLYDRVEIFWMPYTYIISEYNYAGKVYTAITFSHSGQAGKTDYNVTKEERDKMKVQLENKVEKIVAETKNLKSEYEIEKYFNDYICENTKYVTEGYLVSTAYGALLKNKAHCEGYSRAFKILCNAAGIECDLVCGVSFGEGHMWNVVNIDGAHSNVDVTWNDRSENKSYLYFNITNEQIEYDHGLSPLHSKLSDEKIAEDSFNFVVRDASFTGNTYYEKTGNVLPLDYKENAAQRIREAFSSGDTHIELLFTSKNTLSEFQKGNVQFIAGIQFLLEDIKINSYVFERDVLILYFEEK